MSVYSATQSSLKFTNRFTNELPADTNITNQRRQVPAACFSYVAPTKVAAPTLVAAAPQVATMLGLPSDVFVNGAPGLTADGLLQSVAGNSLLEGMTPYACCYGGHQFGNWAGQLGDGRAINLGEIANPRGEHYTLQLKGAGPTPYSRTADGLAVLRSSVREFLCSEAMHHLGVPTTRALSLVTTGEHVVRDMLYDGNPRPEPGAIVCRVAPSFTRFGSYEIHTSRSNISLLRELADFTLRNDFPHLWPASGKASAHDYLAWFREVCNRTATMIVHWMRVGFVHGVMNTDNMSILGLTIDYGPYGWLEDYDPDWTPNTTDAGGKRYRYAHQPKVALWNLVQLANALYPLIEDVEPLRNALEQYSKRYAAEERRMKLDKLGLTTDNGERDDALFESLETLLMRTETDVTLFYRALAQVDLVHAETLGNAELVAPLERAYYLPEGMQAPNLDATAQWLRSYAARACEENITPSERKQKMNATNPLYVLRNYLAQLAIDDAEQGDFGLVNDLFEVLRNPYTEQTGKARFAEKRPDWARDRAGCSMLSCSS
jgi:serine/tyrosine/threonine adenylyltransferase